MSSQQIGEARRSIRPPAIPDDVADPAVVKATGRVTVPAHTGALERAAGKRGPRVRDECG